jgi:CheY-like chemotaxis protein
MMISKRGKGNILVVDDDERTRRMMDAMLTPQGYGVITARDGQEAVDMARKKRPDLVLMDMMMPVMDGLAACLAIKTNETTKKIPVVMLTAAGSDGNKRMAIDIWQADAYVTKPVDIDELRTTLNRLLPRVA